MNLTDQERNDIICTLEMAAENYFLEATKTDEADDITYWQELGERAENLIHKLA